MPDERTRAVLETREFLSGITQNVAVPDEVRRKAKAILRLYADRRHLASVANVYAKLSSAALDDQSVELFLMNGPVFEDPERADTGTSQSIRQKHRRNML
ncbi:BPSL0761 family protein [Pseudomonas sp. gcc21]|uniref:BPSL0761 family protein n=1 Tax=Pseudomonas sp. gcc21 TaxID=2726989 RepID=UPI00273DAC81|nr:BPSL0761 family protein [Pseudomonas sp. gcc21]